MATNPKDIASRQFIAVKIDGKNYFGNPNETILDVAKKNGI